MAHVLKWSVVIMATLGVTQVAYAITESGEFVALVGLVMLIGYAMYDSPTNTKPN
jgi:hypothetical protein